MLDRLQSLLALPEIRLSGLLVAAVLIGLAVHELVRLVVRRTLTETGATRTILKRIDAPARLLLPLALRAAQRVLLLLLLLLSPPLLMQLLDLPLQMYQKEREQSNLKLQ